MAQLGNKYEAEEYWKKTEPHLQARYCHISLGTKIKIESLHAPTHYSGKALTPDKSSIYEMGDITENEIKNNNVDLMVYMTRGRRGTALLDIGNICGGIGKIKAVCTQGNQNIRLKQSINTWLEDTAAFRISKFKYFNTFLSGKN